MKEFKPYSLIHELFIPKSELAEYYVKKRAYYYTHDKKKITTFKKQERIHKGLMKLFSLNRQFIDKQNYAIIGDKRKTDDKNVIYAITHIGKFDYQIITEALNTHTIPFAGDPELTYHNFDGLIFNLNGVVFIDTESKTDRQVAYKTAIDVLKNGYNLMIFPEGIWNISPNNLVEPLYPGVIKMAMETGCDIVPVAIEQYDNDFIINIGENIHIESNLTDELINQEKIKLRDTLATLKYHIMETFPKKIIRREMGDYAKKHQEFVDKRLDEYVNPKTKENYFDEEFIEHRLYKEKDVTKPKDAFSYMSKIDANKNNAFVLRKDDALPESVYEEVEEETVNVKKR